MSKRFFTYKWIRGMLTELTQAKAARMEPEKDAVEGATKPEERSGPWYRCEPSQRPWTQRTKRVQYVRYTGKGYDGKEHIFLRFNLPAGVVKLDQPVFDILQEMKHLDRPTGGRCPTGLKNVKGSQYPKGMLWQLPDTPVGRTAADIIDAKLGELAHKMQEDEGKAR
jgi:hypothetical protein